MRVAFYTLGCKVNSYETQAMLENFKKSGFEIVEPHEPADIYIVNSCTVTAVSDQKTRQAVRRLKRSHPASVLVLTGCMPQAYPEAANALEEADIVIGNTGNAHLVQYIEDYYQNSRHIFEVRPHTQQEAFAASSISAFEDRTRAFVKIQDGCDRFCAYCIIPTARGRIRSRSLSDIRTELDSLVAAGYREAVLTGINLSAYGRDLGIPFTDAIQAAQESGLERIRLGSLEPDYITESMIDTLKNYGKLCPQFHLSLQSGCDETLRRMNRHYTAAQYKALCEQLRSAFPDAAITTDIMAGFPQETEVEFAASIAFAESLSFAKAHVFPYSPRPGTAAAKMAGQIPNAEKQRRAKQMASVCEEGRLRFLQAQTGKTVPVLFETRGNKNTYEGYAPNYTPVKVKNCEKNLCGQICDVKILSSDGQSCYGALAAQK